MVNQEHHSDKTQRLERALHLLLPNKILEDHNTRTESMVLLLVLFLNITVSLLFIPVLYFGFDASPVVFEFGLPILLGCCVNYLVSFLILNRFGSLVIAGNVGLIGIYVSAVYGGWFTGGVYSPMLYILLIPPVFAFVLTNVMSGVLWFLATMLTFFLVWYLDEFSDYEPLFMIANAQEESLMAILMPVASCIMIMFAVVVYEMNSFKLKKLLAQERNLLAFKAMHDPLTGLANREEFNTQISLAINSARHSEYQLSLMYIDLDGFKPVNDEYGHHAGDQVLLNISERLRKLVRSTDTVARLGGDEFAVILQGVGNKENLEPILQKMLDTISQNIDIEGEDITVSVSASIGVAFLDLERSRGEIDGDELCRQADTAMYQAKAMQKNCWCFYDEMDEAKA